jgi:phytoene synthase
MTASELAAAGVRDPLLRESYERCRQLHARHGRTYYLATKLLARSQRPAVHALYGVARWADDIVDAAPAGGDPCAIATQLDQFESDFEAGLRDGASGHPILSAVVDTVLRYRISPALLRDFFVSMSMDLTVRDYPDRLALDTYMYGSAEVVGLQLLPVLGTVGPADEAAPYAAALGKAFQLTNFLRDVGEDLDRGRVYLPADELAAFGVDRDRLQWCRDHGRVDHKVRAALADQHATTRALYSYAKDGIALLHPVSRPCVGTAFTLYGDILDRIEDSDFAVFTQRARVGRWRRARVAVPALIQARWARTQPGGGPAPAFRPRPVS